MKYNINIKNSKQVLNIFFWFYEYLDIFTIKEFFPGHIFWSQ